MKTQIIHLDPHDDLISIRDRMAWAKSPRILLVWPRRGRVGIRPLDLTLLRRHAESLGAELGLVTRDGGIRSVAREEGISCFSKEVDAQKKDWREKKPARPVRRFPRADLRAARSLLPGPELFNVMRGPVRRLVVFFSGVLALLAVMLVFVPSAEVKITPPINEQSLNISVSAEPQTTAVQLSGVVPQHSMSAKMDAVDTALASGSTVLPDQAAKGQVLLMNLTDSAVNLPAGTVLLAPGNAGAAFVTAQDALLAAGKGKTTSVNIQAKAPGRVGNVPPGAITAFEDAQGLNLAVTNPAATTGGTENELPIPTQADRERLKKRMLADIEQQARARFSSQVTPGDVLLPGSLALVNILEETYSPPPGQAGSKLSLHLQVEYSMAFASSSDLNMLAIKVLDASLPAGTNALPGQITLEALSQPAAGGENQSRWQMRVTRKVRRSLDPAQVISLVTGKGTRQAGSLLQQTYGLTQAPAIRISPIWWPWLPFLPIRITVTG